MFGFGKLGPDIFHVRLDGGFVFGKRQLEPNVRIHVTVREVMSYLTQRPSTFTIGGIQLLVRESVEGSPQAGGSLLDVAQVLLLLSRCERATVRKFSDGKARI